MALSLLNYFVFDVQEARIPLLLVDCVMVYGLTVWDSRLKQQDQKVAEHQALAHEVDKQDDRASTAAIRQEHKYAEKKIKHQGQPYVTTKHNIIQPDKNK